MLDNIEKNNLVWARLTHQNAGDQRIKCPVYAN